MDAYVDIFKTLIQYGALGAICAWFALRMERKTDAMSATIAASHEKTSKSVDDLSRSILLMLLSNSGTAHEMKNQAHEVLESVESRQTHTRN
jgi:hypothetical protein